MKFVTLHLKKLYRRFLLGELSLPFNHIISSILSSDRLHVQNYHNISIDLLIPKQRLCLKSMFIDVDNRCNELLPSFSFFNEEFKLGNHLIDSFSDQFSFYLYSLNIKKHMEKLDDIVFRASLNPYFSIVVSNASIENHVTTSISYINSYDKPVIKMIHRAVNITNTEAELFAIQCGINQVVSITNVNRIVIITDSLHATKRIFNSSAYPYQIYSTAISHKLRDFFSKNANNCIEFWDFSSKQKWPLHSLIDKNSKSFNFIPTFSCKSSWNFCKKRKYNSVLLQWGMSFQVADSRRRNFLDLVDDNLNPTKSLNVKGSSWLQYFSHSNSLCTRATRATINHAPIGKYWLRIFSRNDFSYSCGMDPIETRKHILHKCSKFNKYWNSKRDTIIHFALFL